MHLKYLSTNLALPKISLSRIALPAITILSISLFTACSQEPEGHAIEQQPATEVSVARVIEQKITEWDDFSGRLEAADSVELRPRVSGYISEVIFQEGALVKEGDVLLKIDPEIYQADVERLQADLARSESQYSLAKSEYERASRLQDKNAISEEVVENRLAQMQTTDSSLKSIQASLKLAQLNLSYTEVIAPIDGRVSNAFFTKGNFVTAGQSSLTRIVSTNEIHAYFEADERAYLKYVKLAQQGTRPSSRDTENPVLMGLADEDGFPHTGHIDFVDNQINPQTSTIRGRAVFDNSEGLLIPGLFARIRIIGSASYDGILIDNKAISTDLNNKYVLVIDSDNIVQYRSVELGEMIEGLRIIKSGLNPGDIIVVRGLQRIRPGMPVSPVPTDMAPTDVLAKLKSLQTFVDSLSKEEQFAVKPISSSAANKVDVEG